MAFRPISDEVYIRLLILLSQSQRVRVAVSFVGEIALSLTNAKEKNPFRHGMQLCNSKCLDIVKNKGLLRRPGARFVEWLVCAQGMKDERSQRPMAP